MDSSPGTVKYEPLPRWGHASVAVGDKVYMWGGRIEDYSDSSRKKLASVVEVFDIHTELWEQKPTTGTPPKGLYNCAYTAIGDKIYVYGGWDGQTTHGTLHCLDTTSLKWEELKARDSSNAPMKMSGCGLVSCGNDKLVLFGGYGVPVQSDQKVKGVRFKASSEEGEGVEEAPVEEEMKTMTNELKVFDITEKTWSSQTGSGECPPPCVDFSFTRVDEYRALVYGGFQPESGTASDAFILNMESWHWHKLGSETESVTSSISPQWPKGRDGHTSCVLSQQPYPQVLISGGWDKYNQLLYDAWILDISTGTWSELPGIANTSVVGPRFWHTVVSFAYTQRLRQLVFFGGCPSSPVETDDGASWEKLAATVMVEIAQMESLSSAGNRLSYVDVFEAAQDSVNGEAKWVVLDSVNHNQMGQPLRRMREKVLFAEYRANRAELIVKDMTRKMDTMSFRRSVTPSQDAEIFRSIETPDKDVPFWVISRQDVEITPSEIGRGKWSVVRVARFRGENVAARCLTNPIISEDNRKIFIECMDMAAKMHHHPNLLPFYGAVLEGEPVIITELMPTNLRAVAEKNQLLYYQVIGIALDVAKALNFLHSTQPDPIVHGDLTSTTVLLEQGKGNTWKAKLSDFMTSKFFQQLIAADPERAFSPRREKSMSPPRLPSIGETSSPSHSSTPRHNSLSRKSGTNRKPSVTAPDILDPSLLTTKRDVYCYGRILVEMCTGSLPLEVSLSFLIESIRWPDMSGIVKECLSYNPSKRPSMTDIVDRMAELSHAVSISHGHPSRS